MQYSWPILSWILPKITRHLLFTCNWHLSRCVTKVTFHEFHWFVPKIEYIGPFSSTSGADWPDLAPVPKWLTKIFMIRIRGAIISRIFRFWARWGKIYPYFVHFGAQITQFGPGPKVTDQVFPNDLWGRYNVTSVKSLGTIGDEFPP